MTTAEAESTSGGLEPRRRPLQVRSKERFARILEATRTLLHTTGIEALSCEAISVEAEVPIGTVYQFFPNKFAILCELDREDTEAVHATLDSFAQQIPTPDWPDLVDGLITQLAQQWRADPSRRAVWLSMQATAETRAAALDHQNALAAKVARIIAPLTPTTHKKERLTISLVIVHLCYSMLNFSVRDGHAHPAAVRETKRVLLAYLTAVALDDVQRSWFEDEDRIS